MMNNNEMGRVDLEEITEIKKHLGIQDDEPVDYG